MSYCQTFIRVVSTLSKQKRKDVKANFNKGSTSMSNLDLSDFYLNGDKIKKDI